ncbi:MAG: adenylate/guanylate cyclase domain-containing protein [Candidatus Cloacimonetes bacterium]|nr:adenylate/guanylate cyclase domain-containing protein [Candidatus Cloacimonadota bacterium]
MKNINSEGKSQFGHIFSKIYKKWYIGMVIAVIIGLIVTLFHGTDIGKQLEWKTVDYRFRKYTIPQRADSNVVLVAIDNTSLDYLESFGYLWKWPRNFYGIVVNYFSAVGAKAVIFDMMFDDPDIDRAETDASQTDGEFAYFVKEAGNVILGSEFTMNETDVTPDITAFSIKPHSADKLYSRDFKGGIIPIDILLQATKSLGFLNIRPDDDGIIRRVPLIYRYKEHYYPQVAYSAFLLGSDRNDINVKGNTIITNGSQIPVTHDDKYFINWYGPGGNEGVFKYYPFAAVFQSALARQTGGEPTLPEHTFKDKYIILGATASGLSDLRPTPFINPYPGMEIWATTLSNFLNKDFIHIVPAWINILHTILIAFITFIIFIRLKPKIANPLMILVLAYILGITILLWKADRILLNMSMPIIGFVLSYGYSATISYIMEGRSKRDIKKVFTRYLHPDVIETLLVDPDSVKIGGDSITATVLFTDIASFTTFSEGKTPKQLVDYLNEYFDKLTGFVLKNDGLLDKYTGDGIMAMFGAPIQRKDHALIACRAALEHRRYCKDLIGSKEEFTPADNFHIHTRIGLNSGQIVAGNIGSKNRMDYTAIGDNVNLAARLEGVNKIYKTQIMMSESTYELIKDQFLCRELDRLRVKGKTEPTSVYELIDENTEEARRENAWIEEYVQALEYYRHANWNKAIDIFERLSQNPVNDKASGVMLERCKKFKHEVPKDWDGIFTLELK